MKKGDPMEKMVDIVNLCKQLVAISSVVSSSGEVEVAQFIFDWFKELPYFQKNPSHLNKIDIENDSLDRFSILAYVEVNPRSDTTLGIGHFDTVDIEDYSDLKDVATQCDELRHRMIQEDYDSSITEDLQSIDYLWGRGTLDMKSGIAIWMTLIKDICESPKSFNNNILVAFVCDEEGNSKGMMSAIEPILAFKDLHNLRIEGAIDTDYTTQQYDNDDYRYVYFGTVGKLLFHFLAVGKEAHAADPFAGLDANELISAVVQEINMNTAYSDRYLDYQTPPPISLMLQDGRQEYSVQTSKIAWTYFNVTTVSKPIDQWMMEFKKAAEIVMQKVIDKYNQEYKKYCIARGYPVQELPWEVQVIDGSTFDYFENKSSETNERLRTIYHVIEHSNQVSKGQPCLFVFLSPPYYPAHTVNEGDSLFIKRMMKALAHHPIHNLRIEPFYPYISDLSFVRSCSDSDLQSLQKYMPIKSLVNPLFWSSVKQLNCPMVNIGPYGKDAHKNTERVYLPSILWVYQVLQSYIGDKLI